MFHCLYCFIHTHAHTTNSSFLSCIVINFSTIEFMNLVMDQENLLNVEKVYYMRKKIIRRKGILLTRAASHSSH